MSDNNNLADNVLEFPGAAVVEVPPDRPVIRLAAGERPDITMAAIAALQAADGPFYQRGGQLVYVAKIAAKASDGVNILVPGVAAVAPYHLLHELGKAARFEKWDARAKKWHPADPPEDLAKRILALPNEWPFPPLVGIIATPTLRHDGSLLIAPGYDAQSGYVLFDPPDMPPVPERLDRALALQCLSLLDGLLNEFPIVDAVSRAVALSQIMTPVLRPALGGAVPLHIDKAPQSGSGKSYLMDLAAKIAIGERCPVISFTEHNYEENEKRLHGAALSGQPIIGVDNCNGLLRGGDFLHQLIERPLLQIRKLSGSDLITVNNSYSVCANGNNIEVEADMVRRVVRCSLDANVQDPYRRRFREDPLALVAADRGIYVWAVLVIARAYLATGTPDLRRPFMSFAPWSRLVRGSLMWLGCADPVDSCDLLAHEDADAARRAVVFEALARLPGIEDDGYTVAALIVEAKTDDLLREALGEVASSKAADAHLDSNRLGNWLRRNRDRQIENLKLVARDGSRRTKWALQPIISRLN